MLAAKTEAIDAIQTLPEAATMDDIMYKLYVLDKVRQGQADIDKNNTVSIEQLQAKIETW